jgi:hypothetical protein
MKKKRTKRDVCSAGRNRNRCARFKLALVVHLWIFPGIPVLRACGRVVDLFRGSPMRVVQSGWQSVQTARR